MGGGGRVSLNSRSMIGTSLIGSEEEEEEAWSRLVVLILTPIAELRRTTQALP